MELTRILVVGGKINTHFLLEAGYSALTLSSLVPRFEILFNQQAHPSN